MKAIKSIFLVISIICLLFSKTYSARTDTNGEPVPGAEVYIELEPDDEPIANVTTNNDGEIMFTFPDDRNIPKAGVFSMTIIPPKKVKGSKKAALTGMEKQTIQIPFQRKDGPKFKYTVTWELKSKAQNKGAFAVSGKNST